MTVQQRCALLKCTASAVQEPQLLMIAKCLLYQPTPLSESFSRPSVKVTLRSHTCSCDGCDGTLISLQGLKNLLWKNKINKHRHTRHRVTAVNLHTVSQHPQPLLFHTAVAPELHIGLHRAFLLFVRRVSLAPYQVQKRFSTQWAHLRPHRISYMQQTVRRQVDHR